MKELDEKRLARQKLAIKKFKDVNGVGIFQGCTGFGKTYIAIMLIKSLNHNWPDDNIIVVVPSTILRDDWIDPIKGHIKVNRLKNIQVFVINTYVTYTGINEQKSWNCKFLIVDEVHHILSDSALQFRKVLFITSFKFFLGLTATLNDEEKRFIQKLGIRIFDTVTTQEAEKEGYISKSRIYNLSVELSPEDKEVIQQKDAIISSIFPKFQDLGLIYACCGPEDRPTSAKLGNQLIHMTSGQFRTHIAKSMGWKGSPNEPWSTDNIRKMANQCVRSISKRKEILYGGVNKLETVILLLNKFKMQTMVFWQSQDMADELTERIPDICVSIHSKISSECRLDNKVIAKSIDIKGKDKKVRKFYKLLEGDNEILEYSEVKSLYPKAIRVGAERIKKENIKKFESENSPIRIASTVTMLDEGTNVENIKFILVAASFSTKKQDIQRRGRGSRIDYNDLSKKTLVVNLYYYDTQDERWLEKKQSGLNNVVWVSNIDEIKDPADGDYSIASKQKPMYGSGRA